MFSGSHGTHRLWYIGLSIVVSCFLAVSGCLSPDPRTNLQVAIYRVLRLALYVTREIQLFSNKVTVTATKGLKTGYASADKWLKFFSTVVSFCIGRTTRFSSQHYLSDLHTGEV